MSGPLLIQGAMHVETELLSEALEERSEQSIGGYSFVRGRLGAQEIVVSRTGIGTIHCAAATALGIAQFRSAAVINQGLAGAHREDLHVGDIVIGESCAAIHDLKMPRRGRGEGCDPFAWELHRHKDDAPPLILCRADPGLTAFFAGMPYEGRKVVGRLGSGDVFNREYDRILWLRARAGEDCEDMESIAAYQVCGQLGVPCIGVRIISNNELTGEAYERTVGLRLQQFLRVCCLQMDKISVILRQ